jgi:hypothetical protein
VRLKNYSKLGDLSELAERNVPMICITKSECACFAFLACSTDVTCSST